MSLLIIDFTSNLAVFVFSFENEISQFWLVFCCNGIIKSNYAVFLVISFLVDELIRPLVDSIFISFKKKAKTQGCTCNHDVLGSRN